MLIAGGVRFPTVTNDGVYGFFGEYRFLSNFEVCQVHLDGITYNSSEAAFMAQKTTDLAERQKIAAMSPREAKQYGRTLTLRYDWDAYRSIAMLRAVTAKFKQNPHLADKLKATGTRYLEETNDWHDQYWGVEEYVGLNMLGHVLMYVRDFVL